MRADLFCFISKDSRAVKPLLRRNLNQVFEPNFGWISSYVYFVHAPNALEHVVYADGLKFISFLNRSSWGASVLLNVFVRRNRFQCQDQPVGQKHFNLERKNETRKHKQNHSDRSRVFVTWHVRDGAKRRRRWRWWCRARRFNEPAATEHVEHAAKSKHADAAEYHDHVGHSASNWNSASATAREDQSNAAGASLRLAEGET